MKRRSPLRIMTAWSVTLLLANMAGFGSLTASAQMSHGGMTHATTTSTGCLQKCSTAISAVIVNTKKEIEDKQDKKPVYSFPIYSSPYIFDRIKRLAVSPSDDFLLLRPPDLYALINVYRF